MNPIFVHYRPAKRKMIMCLHAKRASKEALERACLTNRLNAVLKVAGKHTKKRLSTHSFRIGQIDNLIQVFGLEEAKRIIGHKSISTTSLYSRAFTSTREMERVMRKVEKLKNMRISRPNLRSQALLFDESKKVIN